MSRATRLARRAHRLPRVQQITGTISSTSLALTLPTTPTAGNYIIVRYMCAATTEANTTPPAGYTKAVSADSTGNTHAAIYYKLAGVAESATVTVARTTSNRITMHVGEYAGLAASSVLDQVATANSAASTVTTQTTGTTPATTVDTELVVTAIGIGGVEGTWGSWSNGLGSVFPSTRGNFGDLVVTSIGTYESTITWSTGQQAAACIATFKGA